MKAIILLGGFGTRLRHVVPDVPKPMAPIAGKPFLAYLLDYLQMQGITDVVFSVHHMREKIRDYFKNQYESILIQYADEDAPLGTGGAIKYSLSFIKTNEPVFVLNGDTFVKVNYKAMYLQHKKRAAQLTMVLRAMHDCSRYGKVDVRNDSVTAFLEKGETGAGLINAGVYLLSTNLFFDYPLPKSFSFEQDFLNPHLRSLKPQAFLASDYFIDIGVPDDYLRAQHELPLLEE